LGQSLKELVEQQCNKFDCLIVSSDTYDPGIIFQRIMHMLEKATQTAGQELFEVYEQAGRLAKYEGPAKIKEVREKFETWIFDRAFSEINKRLTPPGFFFGFNPLEEDPFRIGFFRIYPSNKKGAS